MDHTARKEIPFYYAPGKKLFQIVAKIAAEPGSLGRVLTLLGTKANLVGTVSYTMPDDSSILSAFAETSSDSESAENLRSLVVSSGATLDAEVFEGMDGILVDTFHTGLQTGGDYLVLVRRQALTRMLGSVYTLLGSGGEIVLYDMGIAAGRANVEAMVTSLGPKKVRETFDYLRNSFAAQGWGRVEAKASPNQEASRVLVRDCFECSANDGARKGCHFFRGYIVGQWSAISKEELAVEEKKCRLWGYDLCEFLLKPKYE